MIKNLMKSLIFFCFIPEIVIFFFVFFTVIFLSYFSNFRVNHPSSRLFYYNTRKLSLLMALVLLISIVFLFMLLPTNVVFYYQGGLRFDFFSYVFKTLVLFTFVILFLFYLVNPKNLAYLPNEFLILCLSLLLTSFLLISANDFLMLFLSLDTQAILLFYLMAYDSHSKKATESAWKYFILNGFASSVLLFGISLMFYARNSIVFDDVFLVFSTGASSDTLVYIGFMFFLIGFSIKIGVAPFHWWLADIFEGVNELVLSFLAVISKIGQFGILFYILSKVSFLGLFWFFFVFGLLSLVFGSVQLLNQLSLRRQIAFFSVYSSGLVYIFLGNFTSEIWSFSLYYLFISNLFLLVFIMCLFVLRCPITQQPLVRNFYDFIFVFRNHKVMSFFFVFFLVSLLGLPPLVGFFPKFFFLYSLASHLRFVYISIFLLSTMLLLCPFVYIFKEMFFLMNQNFSFKNRLVVIPFPNLILLSLIFCFSLFLLVDFSSFMLFKMNFYFFE
uniref:NADH dehydrogenase subunit 2 n=1 Tax=Balamuthia mandrillaris TaxID=66527 RepID=A0A0K1HP80_9EUKA|nr:NADH dehydrogenase subunit 2 [Balamuthia mandrillaris]